MSIVVVAALVGCATSSSNVGQVQEVSPGTYSIGVSRSSSVMFGGTEGVTAAVSEAGADAVAIISALLSPNERIEQTARDFLYLLG